MSKKTGGKALVQLRNYIYPINMLFFNSCHILESSFLKLQVFFQGMARNYISPLIIFILIKNALNIT